MKDFFFGFGGVFFFFFFYRGFYCIFLLGGWFEGFGVVSVFFSLSVFFLKEFLGLVARGLKDFFLGGGGGFFFFFYRGFYCIFLLGGWFEGFGVVSVFFSLSVFF